MSTKRTDIRTAVSHALDRYAAAALEWRAAWLAADAVPRGLEHDAEREDRRAHARVLDGRMKEIGRQYRALWCQAKAQHVAPHTYEATQHHDVAAPGAKRAGRSIGVWVRLTRVDALLDGGRIDGAMWEAATAYARDLERCQRGLKTTMSWPQLPSEGGDGAGELGPEDVRLAASARIQAAQACLTREQVRIMEMVSLDLSWPDVAGKLGVSHANTARDRAVRALEGLAEHYGARGTGARMRAVEMV